jgi:hypothetical protein
MLTKDGIGVWGTVPNADGFQLNDVTSEVARHTIVRDVRPDLHGRARIVGYTVLHDLNGPTVAVAVLEDGHEARVIARSTHPDVLRDLCGMQEQCGRDFLVANRTFGPLGATHDC